MCMPTPTNVSGLGYSWGFTSTSDISKAELDGTNNLNYTLGNTISNSDTLTVASHKSPHTQEKVVKGSKRTMYLVNDTFSHTTSTHRNSQPNHTTIQGFSTQNLTGKHFMTPLGPIQLTAEECNEILMKRAIQAAQGLPGSAVLDAGTIQLNHSIINGNIKGLGNEGSGSMSPESQTQSQQHNNTIQQLQLVQAKQEPGTNINSPKNVSIIQGVSGSSLVMYREGSISPLDHNQRSLTSTPGMPKERPFSCDECGKSFLLKHHLTTHSRVHTGERPHACAHCGKAFAHKHCLNTHLLLHSSERPFQCQECKKSFTLKHHLLTHSRVHSRERPFVCTECGRGFPLKRHLVTHSKYHAGERPFVCQDCGESFAQKDHLVMHSRFHGSLNPFVCSDCGAAFTRKFQLVNHGRVHGRVPHSCVICAKEFLQKRTLVAHMKLHTGDAQYACVDCGEAFKNKMDLMQHCKIMHPSNITTTVSVGQQTSSSASQQQQQQDMKPQIVQVVGQADKQKPTVVQVIGQDGSIHEKSTPAYSCPECGNCFNTKEALALHVRLHTGDKTFVSDLCTLTAALQPGNFLNPSTGQHGSTQVQILHGGVLQHTNTANITSAGNAVGSNAVGTTTISSSNAGGGGNSSGVLVGVGSAASNVHHVLHAQPRPKAHFCTDCGKGFASRHGLSQHQRRHPDGGCTMRSHVCDSCGKAFFQKNHLLLHQRQHMDLPPRGSQNSSLYVEKQQQQQQQQQEINQQQNGQQQQQLGGDSSRQSDATNHSSSSNSSLQQAGGATHIQVTNREGQVIGNQILFGGPRNRQIIGNQVHIVNREGKTIGTQINSPGTNLITIKQEHIQNSRDSQSNLSSQQQQLSNNHQQQQQRSDSSHQMSSSGHQQQQVVQQHSESLRDQQQMVSLQHKEGGTTHLTTSTGHLILRNPSRESVSNAQQITQAQVHQLGGAHVMKFEIIPQTSIVQIQPSID